MEQNKELFNTVFRDTACPFCKKDHKSQNRFCSHNCGTVYCYCGNEYHTVDDMPVRRHNPKCGEDEAKDSDVDFFSRKRIFRDRLNSDSIITKMSLSEDVKQRIFAKFDDFSDRFTDKYGVQKSFLPYQYIFFRLLLEEGYQYPYTCPEAKYKAIEELYWSVKDAKDYEEFISFLNWGANIVCEKEYKVFDSPKKIVISEFKHSIKEAYYLLTVKHELDLVIQYFTKFLQKINKRPEYQYNLIIMEMEEERMEITFESIFLYIVDELNERMNLNVMFTIKEEL